MIRSGKVKPAQVAGDPPRSTTDLQDWNSCCTQRARLCRKYLESVRNGKYSRWIFTVEVRDEPCSLCRTCKLHPHSIWTGSPGPGAPAADRSVLVYLHYTQVIRVFLQTRSCRRSLPRKHFTLGPRLFYLLFPEADLNFRLFVRFALRNACSI